MIENNVIILKYGETDGENGEQMPRNLLVLFGIQEVLLLKD